MKAIQGLSLHWAKRDSCLVLRLNGGQKIVENVLKTTVKCSNYY